MKLFCPIRGELNTEERARDGITFTEEYRRIELVKILLNLGYQKELFDFEVNVWDVGNSGRNHIRADLVIYNNLQDKKITIIAEVKRDNKDKESAIEQQLKPSCIRQQANYGIYYDGVENVFFTNQDNYTKEYSLLKFPISGFNFEDKPLKFNDLQTIENINEIIEKINQLLHNVATTKEVRYRELFKIIKAKYFDERENNDTNNVLKFQLSNNTAQNIKNLYNEAKEYYGDNQREKIELDNEVICKIVSLLQNYSFINSKQDILQTLFMKFAKSTLRIELDQFYTPIDITEFITSLIKISNTSKIIDPAGGSADFLVSCLKKNLNCKDSIYYWDKDSNAYEVAKLNMILNGDGRTKMEIRDTIKDYNVSNNTMDFVITNPPFGNKTIYEANDGTLGNYKLYKDYKYKQLGVLYIERCMNLLKENGTLLIVIPYGFLTNPDDVGIRDYLLNNFRVIAFISMPEGAFSQSGTGVKTGILIVKKEQRTTNYNIFVDVATDIGFDYTKKSAKKLYQQNPSNGEDILDNDNRKIPLSDLPNITNRFKKFAYDNQLTKYENDDNNEVYNHITKDEVLHTHTQLCQL